MRRWIAVLLTALAVLAAVDVVAWQWLTSRMRAEWGDFVARQRAAGWQVAAGEPVAEGFPWAARLRVAEVEISHDSKPIPGGLSAGAQTLLLELPFFLPTHLIFKPQGALHLRVGAAPDIDFTATDLTLRRALRDRTFDLAGAGVQAATPFGPILIATVQAQLTEHAPQDPPGGTLNLALSQIGLPPDSRVTLLGPTLDHVTLDVALDNAALTLRGFSLDWGKLSVIGQGHMQRDAQGQPAGDVKLHVFGASETLDALTQAGQINGRDAGNAKMVLSLLQRPGPDGRVSVELPIKLSDRLLSVSGFPVMRVPEVHLPALQTPQ